jgi:hypothetical protein
MAVSSLKVSPAGLSEDERLVPDQVSYLIVAYHKLFDPPENLGDRVELGLDTKKLDFGSANYVIGFMGHDWGQ